MRLVQVPTVREVIHHDWARKYFSHRPEDVLLEEHLDRDYVVAGTSLDFLASRPEGLRSAIMVTRDAAASGRRRRLLIFRGSQRLPEETFYGLFGRRFQRIQSASFGLLLERCPHFFIQDPEGEPTYVIPLPFFARFGVSVRVLEEILEAPVVVPAEALYSRHAFVPSLRVYAAYDGARYGDSTRKLFYDRNGNPVPVELVAREVLRRFGYEAVPPSLFHRLFFAIVGRPPSQFRPEARPAANLARRLPPLEAAARAEERIRTLADTGLVPGIVRALEDLAQRWPYRDFARPEGALPLVSRYLTRRRLESFLETVGERRLVAILVGLVRGHRAVSADWFAYMEGEGRVFPCEVKARGDHLRPSQKESILWCQREGLDYRLLEILHNAPPKP